jgi:hypothetical protein
MYSTFPLMYDAELTIQDLGMLPSSAREWKNVKQEELKRGLWEPIRIDPPSFAYGDLSSITLNTSGLAHQEDIFKGRVANPNKYSQITNSQAYLQLIRDSDREPTAQEIIAANADDIGLDARLIDLINKQSEEGNYYAQESQNFQRKLQASVNNYFKDDNQYRVPMQLEDLPRLFDLASIQARKKLERKALQPFDELRENWRKAIKEGKATVKTLSGIARALGFNQFADSADVVIGYANNAERLDRLFNALESRRDTTITETFIQSLNQ